MIAYRLCRLRYLANSGEGARLKGGRWNPPGVSAIYSASNPSLAVLELLVHFNLLDLPEDYGMTRIEIPDALIEVVGDADLPPGWNDHKWNPSVQAFGEETWLRPGVSAVLSVPSSVIGIQYPSERNLLCNPAHPHFGEIRFQDVQHFRFDPRLAVGTGV